MIYDAIEAVYTVVLANFATDMAALVAAKSVADVNAKINVVKRQPAETYVDRGLALPAVGVYGLRIATQAKNQGARDNVSTVVLDYYAEGADPVVLAKQVELAAEALLVSVDKVTPSGGGVFGAAELVGSVTIELTESYVEAKPDATDRRYWRRALISFPVHDRDTV